MQHDWPKWWAERQQALLDVNWKTFRRDKFLMGGLQEKHKKVSIFWDQCEEDGVPLKMRGDCKLGDPKGKMMGGVFVTSTSLKMAYHLHRIMTHWEAPGDVRVLEIGGGIGGMARTAMLHLPGVRRYTLVDHPVCLEIQRRYLTEVFPKKTGVFDFVPNDRTSYLFGQKFDLVINMHSFNEMTKLVVAGYFELIQDVLVPGGALYIYGRNRYPEELAFKVDVPVKYFSFDDRWNFTLPITDENWAEILAVRK